MRKWKRYEPPKHISTIKNIVYARKNQEKNIDMNCEIETGQNIESLYPYVKNKPQKP